MDFHGPRSFSRFIPLARTSFISKSNHDFAPTPLTFKSVAGNHPKTSKALLFDIPDELLLPIIHNYLDASDLASLALVDVDCRQLARSKQFSWVIFDGSTSSWNLLLRLERELAHIASSALQRYSTINALTICRCIRQVSIDQRRPWGWANAADSRQHLYGVSTNSPRYINYVDRVYSVLIRLSMYCPEFRRLDLDCRNLSYKDIKALAAMRLEHLNLPPQQINQSRGVLVSALRDSKLVLRTLYLGLEPSHPFHPNPESFYAELLRQSSNTLESLVWRTDGIDYRFLSFGPQSTKTHNFPKLERLFLEYIQYQDCTILDALLKAPLTTLAIRAKNIHKIVRQVLTDRGEIPSLKTLALCLHTSAVDNDEYPVEFLRANSNITKLLIEQISENLLTTTLIPLFSTKFRNLKSLSLGWREAGISAKGYKALSTLVSLEHIHISVSRGLLQSRLVDFWLVNHRDMRHTFRKLTKLKTVAFTGDTYLYGNLTRDPRGVEYYYNHDMVSPNVDENGRRLDYRARNAIWNSEHWAKMEAEAKEYVAVLPKLEWLYFGRLPMRIVRSESGSKRTVQRLSSAIVDCSILIANMFGFDGLLKDYSRHLVNPFFG